MKPKMTKVLLSLPCSLKQRVQKYAEASALTVTYVMRRAAEAIVNQRIERAEGE